MKLLKKRSYCLALAAVLTGLGAFPVTPARAAVTWSTVVHPDANAQPTALGRWIHAADKSGSLVYFGYGDYATNTGPIVIRSLNPARGVLSGPQFTQDTEAIEVFRTIGGKIYSPAIDTVNGFDFAVNESGLWSQPVDNITSYHLYDITQRVPGELLLSGSTYGDCAVIGCDGAVWKSTDGGDTWTHTFLEPDAAGTDLSRCFEMVSFDGIAYVRCSSGEYSYNGRTWQTTPHKVASYESVMFDGRLVIGRFDEVWSFDGTTVKHISPFGGSTRPDTDRIVEAGSSASRGIAVDGHYLYTVYGGRIMRTEDLDTCGVDVRSSTTGHIAGASVSSCPYWEEVAPVPAGTSWTDFTVVNGHVVLSGYDATIHYSSKLPRNWLQRL